VFPGGYGLQRFDNMLSARQRTSPVISDHRNLNDYAALD
jgi:hypothetical protein